MTSSEKKNRAKGIIGTIILHTSILVIFFFTGLKYPDPPPLEEGININLGFSKKGLGEIKTEDNEKKIEVVKEKIINSELENNEEIITQTQNENVNLETHQDTKEKKEEEENEKIEENKPKINQKALYTGKNNEKSEGKNIEKGTQGEIIGEINSFNYNEGSSGEDGSKYKIGSRKAILKPKPKGNQTVGKVAVIITVNRLGDVIYAKAGAQGSTTQDKNLLERAKQAALKWKYEANPNGPKNQTGKIIFDFSLN